MWVMTPRGFYSVVEHRDEPLDVLVRARSKRDLVSLRELIPELEIEATPKADYPFRTRVEKVAWVSAVAQMGAEIRYPNFKLEIAASNGWRARTYHQVWDALLAIEEEPN